jgi:uncharacterized damage-inducible protein DinB
LIKKCLPAILPLPKPYYISGIRNVSGFTSYKQSQPQEFSAILLRAHPTDALEGLVNQSNEFSDYVHSLSDNDLLKEVTLNATWMQGSLPQYEYIQHCFNHSTYHRGQIITISRMLGLSGQPGTDYNYYNMKGKGDGK